MDLFPSTKDFKNSTWVDLSRDSSIWDEYITTEIKKVLKNRPVSITIVWSNKEDKKGYGLGSVIVVHTHNKNRFSVPILLDSFKLAPLDTMLTDDNAYTFTEENVDDILFSGDLAVGVSDKDRKDESAWSPDQQSQNGNTIPGDGGTITKFASILAEMKDTFTMSDIAKTREQLEDPLTLYKFSGEKSIFVELLTNSLLGKKDKPEKKIQVIKKEGDAYVIMANSFQNFEPIMEVVNGQTVKAVLKNDFSPQLADRIIEEVDVNGQRPAIVPWEKNDNNILVDNPELDENVTCEKNGFYSFNTSSGEADGLFVRKLYDPTKRTLLGGGIVLTNLGGSVVQGKVEGKSITSANLTEKAPSVGDYGVLVYVTDSEDVLAVGPFEVMTSQMDRYDKNWDDRRYKIRTSTGEVRDLTFSSYMQGIFDDDDDGCCGAIASPRSNMGPSIEKKVKRLRLSSKNVGWFPITKEIKILSPSKEVDMKKKASVTWDGYFYEVSGVDGLGNTCSPGDEADASFALSMCGAGMEKIAGILKLARYYGGVRVSGLAVPQDVEPEFVEMPFDLSSYNFTKMASAFEDMTTIDAVLALNFLNPSNLKRFASVLPMFSKAKEELIRQRILSRLGRNDVPEDSISQAIEALEKVIEGLEKMKSRL